MDRPPGLNRAVARLKAGQCSATAKVEVSTAGLLAIGVLVSGVLVSTSVLVWAARAARRGRPGLPAPRR